MFIPTQIINFAIVPHHMRFVVVGVVSLFWSKWCHLMSFRVRSSPPLDTYLSAVNARAQCQLEREKSDQVLL